MKNNVMFWVTSGVFSLFAVMGIVSPSQAEKEKQRVYVGVQKCAKCHKKESEGEQYKKWLGSPHSKAYKILGEAKAKEVGKKMGIDNPQESPKCLKCHVTAYGVDKEFLDEEGYKKEDGVTCESCHGAGKDYSPKTTMKNREKAKSKGLHFMQPKDCAKCHNEESPSYKGPYNFVEKFQKIKHYRPDGKPSKEWQMEEKKDK